MLDTKSLIVFTLIQSLLPPSRLKTKQQKHDKNKSSKCEKSQKGNKFFTNIESKRSFISFAPTEEAYTEHLVNKIECESSIPPTITVIGDIFKPLSFFVDFDNIKYKVFTLPRAIDIAFKSYNLFNIKYHDACVHMWDFINILFYGIQSTPANPATHMLCKTISGELNKKKIISK